MLLLSPSLADVSSTSALVVFSENRDRILENTEVEIGQFIFFSFSGDAMNSDEGDGMLAVEELISRYVLRHQGHSLDATAAIEKGRLEGLALEFGLVGNKISYLNLPRWVVFNGRDDGKFIYVVALRKSDLSELAVTKPSITLNAVIRELQQRLQQTADASLFYYSINAFDCAISIHNEQLNQNSIFANYVAQPEGEFSTEWFSELRIQMSKLEGERLQFPAAKMLLAKFPALPEIFACLGRNYLVGNDFTAYINCMMLAGPGVDNVFHAEFFDVIAKTSNVALKEYPLRLENVATKTYPPIVSFVRKQQGFVNFSGDWDRSASQFHYRKAESKFSKGEAIDTIQRDLFDALKSDPTHSESWNLLGVLIKNSGDVQGAVACFRQALRLDPKAPNPMANLALIYESQSKHQLAAGMALAACLHAAPGEWAYRRAEELLSKN
jgi:tetratricopeptide (TPR) repeat protein